MVILTRSLKEYKAIVVKADEESPSIKGLGFIPESVSLWNCSTHKVFESLLIVSECHRFTELRSKNRPLNGCPKYVMEMLE